MRPQLGSYAINPSKISYTNRKFMIKHLAIILRESMEY